MMNRSWVTTKQRPCGTGPRPEAAGWNYGRVAELQIISGRSGIRCIGGQHQRRADISRYRANKVIGREIIDFHSWKNIACVRRPHRYVWGTCENCACAADNRHPARGTLRWVPHQEPSVVRGHGVENVAEIIERVSRRDFSNGDRGGDRARRAIKVVWRRRVHVQQVAVAAHQPRRGDKAVYRRNVIQGSARIDIEVRFTEVGNVIQAGEVEKTMNTFTTASKGVW